MRSSPMFKNWAEPSGLEVEGITHGIADTGGTPLVVAEGNKILGVIHLKDVVKGGIRERFQRFRAMGIRTVMITGDNPRTAAAIAREAGVDDFLAASDAGSKNAADQRRAGQGKTGGDDRRRHQRCAGAGAGGRRRGDEHGHASGQRSRQHGRSWIPIRPNCWKWSRSANRCS